MNINDPTHQLHWLHLLLVNSKIGIRRLYKVLPLYTEFKLFIM